MESMCHFAILALDTTGRMAYIFIALFPFSETKWLFHCLPGSHIN